MMASDATGDSSERDSAHHFFGYNAAIDRERSLDHPSLSSRREWHHRLLQWTAFSTIQ
jgi:hypothetical protein